MKEIEVRVKRVLTRDEASSLVGETVVEREPNLPRPKIGEVVKIYDDETGDLIGMISRLPRDLQSSMRWAVQRMKMTATGRGTVGMENGGRTFGFAPKRLLAQRGTCRSAGSAIEHPDEHAVLSETSLWLADQFRELAPEIAASNEEILAEVNRDWIMEEKSFWTSGVVNKTSQLPYHRDSTNFPTWSAMPTLRKNIAGGHLHVVEYDIVFPTGDGDVSWFWGQEYVHGVTPMRTTEEGGYRYSIVYYALRGMKSCRTIAEETAAAALERTERERRMADEARARLAEQAAA